MIESKASGFLRDFGLDRREKKESGKEKEGMEGRGLGISRFIKDLYRHIYIFINESYYIMPYNSRADVCRLQAER